MTSSHFLVSDLEAGIILLYIYIYIFLLLMWKINVWKNDFKKKLKLPRIETLVDLENNNIIYKI